LKAKSVKVVELTQEQQRVVRFEVFPLRISRKIMDLGHHILPWSGNFIQQSLPASQSPRDGRERARAAARRQ
jgi:hypothetical protein